MDAEELVEVVVTAEDGEWLAGWARALVEDRLAACGHVQPGVRAVYRWDGAVHDDQQARVALHTRLSLVGEITARADVEHPDEVPCVIALPLRGGHPDYWTWVVAETREP
ncbi:divalent-cation tolerance protein CutA [Modestobacter sp. SYSU DS0511]